MGSNRHFSRNYDLESSFWNYHRLLDQVSVWGGVGVCDHGLLIKRWAIVQPEWVNIGFNNFLKLFDPPFDAFPGHGF
jgi:hypothetical protein